MLSPIFTTCSHPFYTMFSPLFTPCSHTFYTMFSQFYMFSPILHVIPCFYNMFSPGFEHTLTSFYNMLLPSFTTSSHPFYNLFPAVLLTMVSLVLHVLIHFTTCSPLFLQHVLPCFYNMFSPVFTTCSHLFLQHVLTC